MQMDIIKNSLSWGEKGCKQIIWMQGDNLHKNGYKRPGTLSRQAGRKPQGSLAVLWGQASKNNLISVSTVSPDIARVQYLLFVPPESLILWSTVNPDRRLDAGRKVGQHIYPLSDLPQRQHSLGLAVPPGCRSELLLRRPSSYTFSFWVSVASLPVPLG